MSTEFEFDAKVKEADDIDIKEYSFSPTLLENGVIDYSNIEHDKIFLVNKHDILEKEKPDWIPELDLDGLMADEFLPTTIKSSDGFYYVQAKKLTDILDNKNDPNKRYETQIYKMSSDILAATVDYYIKKQKALNKQVGKKETVGLPRRTKSMYTSRFQNMVDLLRFVPEYKENEALLKHYPNRSKSEAYRKQNKIIFDQYKDLLGNLKDKILDLNLDKIDYGNAYTKGEITSYGDTGLSNSLYEDFGVRIKKQNGSTFSLEQKNRVESVLKDTYSYYGDLSNISKDFHLKLSYADNCRQHARKSIGLFTPYHNAIGVSFFDDNTYERTTAVHEFAHFLDYTKGNEFSYRYASDKDGSLENQIATKYKKLIREQNENNKSKVGESKTIKLGDYWYRTCECFARAMEQDFELTIGLKEKCNPPAYLPEEIFNKEIKPLIEELKKENEIKLNLIPGKFVTLTTKIKGNVMEQTKDFGTLENVFEDNKLIDSIFQTVSKEFNEKNKDFFNIYEEQKSKQIENLSKNISNIKEKMLFSKIHSEMLKIRVEELKEMVKRCPNKDIALAVSIRYFNYFGNIEGNISHQNLYTCFGIGHYEKDQMVYPTPEELKSFISKLYENSKKQETYIWNHYEDGSCCLKAPNGKKYFVYDPDADEVKITEDSNWIRRDELNLGDKTFTQYAEDYVLENNPTTYISFETNGKNIEKEQNVDESKQYSFFVKDTAEFEMFEEFETITGLTAKEAISEYKRLREDGLKAGIGINIPSDTTFDDPNGLGTTILVRENGVDTFDIYGDSFIVDLKENNEKSQNRIAAYKELYEEAKEQKLNVKEPVFLFEKEKELGFEISELKRNEIATLLQIELNQSKITEKEIINRVEKGKNLVKSYFFEHWKDDKEKGVFDLWATHDAMRYVGFNLEIQNYENGKYVDVYNQEEKKELEKINQTMKNLLNEYSSELIERMNNNSNKFLFIFEKLQAAGIEVVFDKEEFDRILEREKLLQKMAESKSGKYLNTDDVKLLNDMGYIKDDFEQIQYAMLVSDIKLNGKKTSTKKTIEILGRKDFLSGIARSAFHGSSERINGDNSVSFDSFILFERAFSGLSIEKRNQLNDAQQKAKEHVESLNEIVRQESYFSFDVEDEKKFINHIDDWQKDNTNPLKMIIVGKVPPVMKVLGISEKLIEIEQSTLDKMLRDEPIYPNDKQGHKLSLDDIYAIPSQLADPVMVFKSRSRNDSYVFFTERKDLENRSILIPLAVDKKKGRLVIHEITSMYGKDNEINFVKTNIDENNLIYEDRKRSCLWANEKVTELKKRSSNGERFTQIQFLGQRFTDNGTYVFNILTKERLVNFLNGINGKNTQNFITQDGRTYGFAHENKIYLNPNIVSSEAAIHEYTHLWDNYTKVTNPELWNKGKDIFKNTYLWEEVKNDVHYQDISHDEDLILSECHARITGKIADKILDKILIENGELTKDTVIVWDKEVFEYISKEFGGKDIDVQSVSEFVSQTMKDFMDGKVMPKIDSYRINHNHDYFLSQKAIEFRIEQAKALTKAFFVENWEQSSKDEFVQKAMEYTLEPNSTVLFDKYLKEKEVEVYTKEEQEKMEQANNSIKEIVKQYSKELFETYNQKEKLNKFWSEADIVDTVPDGWKKAQGVTTVPNGYVAITNGKSRFADGEKRETKLIREENYKQTELELDFGLIPMMPKIELKEPEKQIIKEEVKLPFSIINNVEKGRVNIKFDQKISDKKFNSILKELKSAGWRFSSFNKQWYPVGKAVEKSETFVKELQEKYAKSEETITYATASFEEFSQTITESQIQKSPYDGIKFFDRNYKEIDEFVAYFNRNLNVFGKDVAPIDEKIAETIFESLQVDRVGTLNSRTIRLGLDASDNLVLLNKEKNEIETKNITLKELFFLAKETLEKEKQSLDEMLEKFNKKDNKEQFISVFGNLFQSAKDKNTELTNKMDVIFEAYIKEPTQQTKKISKVKPLKVGDSIGDEIVQDVFEMAKGVYQATLMKNINEGPGTYFILDKNIVEKLNPELHQFLEEKDEHSIFETSSRTTPHIIKELIDKKLCPPRDNEYYHQLVLHTQNNPLKYEVLYPVTKYNFKNKLKQICEIDKDFNHDVLTMGKQLLSFATENDKREISRWLRDDVGCDDEKLLRNVFSNWVSEKEIKQEKKKDGYPPRGE